MIAAPIEDIATIDWIYICLAGYSRATGIAPGRWSRHARNRHHELSEGWRSNPRWRGVRRDYTAEDVHRLRPQVLVEHTLARVGAERLWRLLAERDHVPALGALTGGQAVQMVKAGLEAIYLSGWQVAADANLAGQVYPDQSLYPANSVPSVVQRINNALLRAEQVARVEGDRPLLCGADRGRRRGRVRGAAERLRADRRDDRRRGGRDPLRGPAGQREEVRAPGRQGAGPDRPVHPHPAGGPAGRRRRRRADGAGRQDRRPGRHPAHQRRGRAGPALLHRGAHRRGLLPGHAPASRPRSPAPWPTPPTPTCCGARPPPPTWTRPASSPRRSTPSSRASCWPTTARPASTGAGSSTTRRSPGSRRSWPPWATGSSSSPWPGSTA